MKPENLPELWQITLQFLYNDEYVESLISFLRKRKVQTVLDCACGIGFPAIELKRAGFDVYCTDGSKQMIERFRLNLKKAGVEIPHQVLDWRRLSFLDKKFDAVLCRGNSLIYLDSWESEVQLPDFSVKVEIALRQMRSVLSEHGLLYVDMTSENEYGQESPLVEGMGTRIVNSQSMTLIWKVNHDWVNRIRTICSIRRVEDTVFVHDYHSFLLRHRELRDLLSKAGFENTERIVLAGENSYDVFIASG